MAGQPFLPPLGWGITDWLKRPAFVQYVKHAYWVGGYDILPNVGLALDEEGLDWVRTFNLRDRKTHVEFRLIEPEDLPIIVGQAVSYDKVVEMYGPPVDYEPYQAWRREYGIAVTYQDRLARNHI